MIGWAAAGTAFCRRSGSINNGTGWTISTDDAARASKCPFGVVYDDHRGGAAGRGGCGRRRHLVVAAAWRFVAGHEHPAAHGPPRQLRVVDHRARRDRGVRCYRSAFAGEVEQHERQRHSADRAGRHAREAGRFSRGAGFIGPRGAAHEPEDFGERRQGGRSRGPQQLRRGRHCQAGVSRRHVPAGSADDRERAVCRRGESQPGERVLRVQPEAGLEGLREREPVGGGPVCGGESQQGSGRGPDEDHGLGRVHEAQAGVYAGERDPDRQGQVGCGSEQPSARNRKVARPGRPSCQVYDHRAAGRHREIRAPHRPARRPAVHRRGGHDRSRAASDHQIAECGFDAREPDGQRIAGAIPTTWLRGRHSARGLRRSGVARRGGAASTSTRSRPVGGKRTSRNTRRIFKSTTWLRT